MTWKNEFATSKNPLKQYFAKNEENLINKWLHYFDIYHKYFQEYRGEAVTVVEFGVFHGGSLRMWKDYFGEKARIYGIDIDPRCKQFEESQIEILIGDQQNREFLRTVRERAGSIDILIEDGGHKPKQQIATFEEMFPAVAAGGVFLIEDLHTSYWNEYDGGYKRTGTYIEYAKNLLDKMHAWHSREKTLTIDYYTKHIKAMHMYDSVIVFEKAEVPRPEVHEVGKPILTFEEPKTRPQGLLQRIFKN